MLRRILFLSLLLCATVADAASCPRIVSQSPYITRVLNWYGLSSCIVGVSRYEKMDSLRDLPRTGGVKDPDVDAIAFLDPQLLITSDWTQEDVWRAATPAGAKALRVGGFRGMTEVEAMLRDIGHAAGVKDADARVRRFHRDWLAAAKRVHGNGRRVLLMAACGGTPYSYGRGTTAYDLFTAAGYRVVADHDDLHHFNDGGDIESWIKARHPAAIMAFGSERAEACNVHVVNAGVPLVHVDGKLFNQPGPALLEGLAQLRNLEQGEPQ